MRECRSEYLAELPWDVADDELEVREAREEDGPVPIVLKDRNEDPREVHEALSARVVGVLVVLDAER